MGSSDELNELLRKVMERTKSIKSMASKVQEKAESLRDLSERARALDLRRDDEKRREGGETGLEKFSIILSLNDDILRFYILPHLDSSQLVLLSLTCVRLKSLVYEEALWSSLLVRRWGAPLAEVAVNRVKSLECYEEEDEEELNEELHAHSHAEVEEKGEVPGASASGVREYGGEEGMHAPPVSNSVGGSSTDKSREWVPFPSKKNGVDEAAGLTRRACLLMDSEWKEAVEVIHDLPLGPFSLAGIERKKTVLLALRTLSLVLSKVVGNVGGDRGDDILNDVVKEGNKLKGLCEGANEGVVAAALEVMAELATFPSVQAAVSSMVETTAARCAAGHLTPITKMAARAILHLRGLRISEEIGIDGDSAEVIRRDHFPDPESTWKARFFFPRDNAGSYEKILVLSPLGYLNMEAASTAAHSWRVHVEGIAQGEESIPKAVEGEMFFHSTWGSAELSVGRSETLHMCPCVDGWFGVWKVLQSCGFVHMSRIDERK